MEEQELTDVTLAQKYENYDRGYCKSKNACPKIHPNKNCDWKCEDKRNCNKPQKILFKKSQHVLGILVNFFTSMKNIKKGKYWNECVEEGVEDIIANNEVNINKLLDSKL